MNKTRKSHYLQHAWILIAVFTIARMVYAQQFLLVPDETNYWQWARHLDWGYHDQAPMIAWAIWLFTSLLGHIEVAVRLPSILSLTIASIYLVLMARHWFDDRIAWYVAVASQSIFLFNVGALLATADGLQAAAWAGACYHAARAYEQNGWGQWLLGGFWFGFGLLSKYTMVLFLPCLLAYALLSRVHRKRMASFKPYAACLLGLLMFAPVILWNASHQWNSVRHVAYIGGANESFTIHWNFFGDYIASQAALLTPMIFILVCAAWYRIFRQQYPKDQWIYPFLFFTSFPVVAGFALLSLHTRVYGNWPGLGYVSAVLLMVVVCSPSDIVRNDGGLRHKPSSKLWYWSVGSAYFLTGIVLLHVILPILPIPAKLDRAAQETQGWKALASQTGQVQSGMPRPEQTFIFGVRYQMASELAFYMPGQPQTVSINQWSRPNVYDYWWRDEDLMGWDGVGVIENQEARPLLVKIFDKVDPPTTIDVFSAPLIWKKRGGRPPMKTYYLYRCYGFKGGLRWVPPNKEDIRAVDP